MTYNNIYEYFGSDEDLLDYFDPLSCAINKESAVLEIYHKLIEYSKKYKCSFIRMDHGYVFYANPRWFWGKKMLISFCLKKEYRGRISTSLFWLEIKKHLGRHFTCCLFNKNTRAINFLCKGGMKVKKENDLITLLSI